MAEIASCSYEARAVSLFVFSYHRALKSGFTQAGVKNGMFFGKAKEACPDLVPIPYDYEEYKRVSWILYDTIAR
jgi:DNA repair protein REV1